jgi:hypothetical protein
MKKFIYSALVAIVAVGAVQSVKATIYDASGNSYPCSQGSPLNCSTRTGVPASTPAYLQNPISNPGTPPVGTFASYHYDLAD